MSKVNVTLKKVKGNQFEGYVYTEDLKEDQRINLGYMGAYPSTTEIHGEFSIEWNRDYPVLCIDYVQAVGPFWPDLPGASLLLLDNVDTNRLTKDIEDANMDLLQEAIQDFYRNN